MTHRRAAVLGSPIAHSLSPALHRAAYAALDLDWTYDPIEVTADTLPAFLGSLDDTWAGLSLTMPLKEAVLPLLDEVSDLAREVAAANTVVLVSGRRIGTNTDVPGMVRALRETGGAAAVARAVILGAGATARSTVAALSLLGVQEITLVVRRPEAAASLVALAHRRDMRATVTSWSQVVGSGIEDVDLVVSTVPGDAAAMLVPALTDMLDRPHVCAPVLLDVAYHPWPTPLLSVWAQRGAPAATGLDLLLWQAVDQVQLMTGREAPVAAMRAALPATPAG